MINKEKMMIKTEPKYKIIYLEGEQICVDWLIYRSYEANRDYSPQITPSRWRALYLNQELYEKIYQRSRS